MVDKSEQHKAFLEKNISQRREINFISKLIEKNGKTYTPSVCFIKGKESICERTFQVFFGSRPFDIPYSKVKDIWEVKDTRENNSGKIQIELDSTIILDENARLGEEFTFESEQ